MKVLTINRHTGYLYVMCKTGHEFFVAGEPWDLEQRPQPINVKLLSSGEAKLLRVDVVVGHAPATDFATWGCRSIAMGVPYVQVFHGRLERTSRGASRARAMVKKWFALLLGTLARLPRVHFVFISESVKRSWGLPGTVIRPGIPVDEMGPYDGREATLLVVANDLHRPHFAFDVLRELSCSLPVRVVGDNPGLARLGAARARSWDELRRHYNSCRAYLNITREPEDGYNLATLEAMASGMPVVTLYHPTSPIIDGKNGFVGATPAELKQKAALLLNDLTLARRMGAAARETVVGEFALERFVSRWNQVLERGRENLR